MKIGRNPLCCGAFVDLDISVSIFSRFYTHFLVVEGDGSYKAGPGSSGF